MKRKTLFPKILSILFCLMVLCSCQIGNPDYKYIYENKCILTGRTGLEEFTNYLYVPIDTYGNMMIVPYDDSYTKYEYECMDGTLQWSRVKYDITQFYNKTKEEQ